MIFKIKNLRLWIQELLFLCESNLEEKYVFRHLSTGTQ